uniref:Uncharacterized protein n=1 Tax=Arundo donax TaxID=35708 RepID=A0A0A9T3S0_ARUDO
MREQREEMR